MVEQRAEECMESARNKSEIAEKNQIVIFAFIVNLCKIPSYAHEINIK